MMTYSDSKRESDYDYISVYSESFNMALSALSKIVLKYGKEILATENNQKLKGLISDFFPYRNEVCPILKQALSCDFTQLFLNCENNDKKESAIKEAVEKIVEETNLEKESATSVVKLVTLSLGWDLEKNYDEESKASNLPQSNLDENNSQNSTSQNEQSASNSNKKIIKKLLIYFVAIGMFFLVLTVINKKEFLEHRIKAWQGNAEAQNKLGNCYYNGDIVEQDYNRAVYWYEKSAEQGYVNAQYNLGLSYYKGEGVEQNYENAVHWFEKSAEQGFGAAQCVLGSCYFLGNGVDVDLQRGIYWYEKSALQGNKDAQYNLGVCYYKGEGVSKDLKQAFIWFSRSAEQEHTEALNYLGVCYMVGDGVDKDEGLGILYLKKSAEQGSATAQYNLGLCYYNGEGTVQNYEQAVYWCKKSAEQGNANAQYNLGICYYNGEGVLKNLDQAIFWLKKAEEQGLEEAQELLKKAEFIKHGITGIKDGNTLVVSHSDMEMLYDNKDYIKKLSVKDYTSMAKNKKLDNVIKIYGKVYMVRKSILGEYIVELNDSVNVVFPKNISQNMINELMAYKRGDYFEWIVMPRESLFGFYFDVPVWNQNGVYIVKP